MFSVLFTITLLVGLLGAMSSTFFIGYGRGKETGQRNPQIKQGILIVPDKEMNHVIEIYGIKDENAVQILRDCAKGLYDSLQLERDSSREMKKIVRIK